MINVVVIGVGRMGSVHANNLLKKRVKGAVLYGIVDTNPQALAVFDKANIQKYSSHSAMLMDQNVDAVIIATPHYTHVEIGLDCIARGLHVLVEKPVSVTTISANRLLSEAQKYPKLTLAIMYNQRTNPLYARAKQLIDEGKIGKIVRANFIITDWYRSQAYYNQGGWRASYNGEGGGCLINQCIHQLDILQWLIGLPREVISTNRTIGRDITVENDVTATLVYPDFFCSFSASTHELCGTNRLEIVGEQGKIIIDKKKMTFYLHNLAEPIVNLATKKGYGMVRTQKNQKRFGLYQLLKFYIYGQQINILRNFINAILGKEELISPLKDSYGALCLLNAMYLSSWQKQAVTLPIDDIEYEKELNTKKEEELRGGNNG